MDYNELKELIVKAIREGEMTVEDLQALGRSSVVTHKDECNIDIFHSLFCKSKHSEDECDYYLEERMEDKWLKPFHKTWRELYTQYLTKHKLSSTDVAEELALVVKASTLKGSLGILHNFVHTMNKVQDNLLATAEE